MAKRVRVQAAIDREIEAYLADKEAGFQFSSSVIAQKVHCYGGVDANEVAARLKLRSDVRSMREKGYHCGDFIAVWEYLGAGNADSD